MTCSTAWPTIFPALPQLQVKAVDLQPLMPGLPWIAMHGFLIAFYPVRDRAGDAAPAGPALLVLVLLSLLEGADGDRGHAGLRAAAQRPLHHEQAVGGYIGIALAVLWTERLTSARSGARRWAAAAPTTRASRISYRAALLGLGIGFLALVGFMNAAGMSAWLAVAFFALYLLMSLSISRMRAELGPPAHDLGNAGPDQMIVRWVGSANVSPANLSALSMTWWFNRAYRSHPMPVQLEGFKMAERAGADQRGMFWAILVAGIVGSLAAFWALLDCLYRYGPGLGGRPALIFGSEPYAHLGEWLTQPKGPSVAGDRGQRGGHRHGDRAAGGARAVRGVPVSPAGLRGEQQLGDELLLDAAADRLGGQTACCCATAGCGSISGRCRSSSGSSWASSWWAACGHSSASPSTSPPTASGCDASGAFIVANHGKCV